MQEILYIIERWVHEGSGWIIEKIYSQYINISAFRPLIGSSYIKLLAELKNPKKELINFKNNDERCFLSCHVRHLNPLKIHPEGITKLDKELTNTLDYETSEFPVPKKGFNKIEIKNKICINVFLL